jgi:conjugative transfer signal peptidase TraF
MSSADAVTGHRSKRVRTLAAVLLAAAGTLAFAALVSRYFTWNLTPSLPRGLYLLVPDAQPKCGDTVLLAVPPAVRALVIARHYLPPETALLKVVVALAGDRACLDGRTFVVERWVVAAVRDVDTLGRRLEPARYCGVVPDGDALVATHAVLSFDSRYFGAVPLSALTVARPLWTF